MRFGWTSIAFARLITIIITHIRRVATAIRHPKVVWKMPFNARTDSPFVRLKNIVSNAISVSAWVPSLLRWIWTVHRTHIQRTSTNTKSERNEFKIPENVPVCNTYNESDCVTPFLSSTLFSNRITNSIRMKHENPPESFVGMSWHVLASGDRFLLLRIPFRVRSESQILTQRNTPPASAPARTCDSPIKWYIFPGNSLCCCFSSLLPGRIPSPLCLRIWFFFYCIIICGHRHRDYTSFLWIWPGIKLNQMLMHTLRTYCCPDQQQKMVQIGRVDKRAAREVSPCCVWTAIDPFNMLPVAG